MLATGADGVALQAHHDHLFDFAERVFKPEDGGAGEEKDGLRLGLVHLEAEAMAGADVQELAGVGQPRWREEGLVAPGLLDMEAEGGFLLGGGGERRRHLRCTVAGAAQWWR